MWVLVPERGFDYWLCFKGFHSILLSGHYDRRTFQKPKGEGEVWAVSNGHACLVCFY